MEKRSKLRIALEILYIVIFCTLSFYLVSLFVESEYMIWPNNEIIELVVSALLCILVVIWGYLLAKAFVLFVGLIESLATPQENSTIEKAYDLCTTNDNDFDRFVGTFATMELALEQIRRMNQVQESIMIYYITENEEFDDDELVRELVDQHHE